MITADSAWKEVCEKKLSLVFALLYPRVHRELDWSQDADPLDQELRQFAAASRTGGRIADRLIRAFAGDSGDPRYFHLEVQGKKERGFRRRVHVCNLRAEERFNAHIVSMVILTDKNPKWRPSRYVAGQFPVEREPTGGPPAPAPSGKKRRRRYLDERTLRFLTVKLIDYRGHEAKLEALDNPMGLFVVAHLEAMRTRKDPDAREQAKLRLLRNLRQRKMDLEDARFWHTCLDWFLQLPGDRELALRQELQRLDTEEKMPYLSFIERHALEQGMEKGRGEGKLEALGLYLKAKFGEEALAWLSPVRTISDEAQLNALCERVFAAPGADADQVRALLASAAGASPPPA